jgi:hypothetical protein
LREPITPEDMSFSVSPMAMGKPGLPRRFSGKGHFVTYEGMPSDWYLRLVGEGARVLHEKSVVPPEIPIQP